MAPWHRQPKDRHPPKRQPMDTGCDATASTSAPGAGPPSYSCSKSTQHSPQGHHERARHDGRRRHRPGDPRVIAVPVDDSGHSRHALDWALSHLVTGRDRLHLLSVEEPTAGPYPAEMPDVLCPTTGDIVHHQLEVKDHVQQSRQLLADSGEIACSMGVKASRISLVQLPPQGGASGVAESIVRYANRSGIDMVVVGSRGMLGPKRWLTSIIGLGSVSDYLAVHANCPVVVVKSTSSAQGALNPYKT